MNNSDEINIAVQPPSDTGDFWLVDVDGYAGTQATIGTGEDAVVALESALVNLEQLRASLVIKLLEVRVSEHIKSLHPDEAVGE
jgi:hypothetical protein